MIMIIDTILEGKRRRLRTNPEKVLMDASGLRLWADYLDVEPWVFRKDRFYSQNKYPFPFPNPMFCGERVRTFPNNMETEPHYITF